MSLSVYKYIEKIKSRKAVGHDKIPVVVRETRKFDDIILIMQQSLNKNTIEKLIKDCILSFPKKSIL